MASLDKLAIRNIRSFDNNISIIQFYSPLTVIVGQNGSGKTTIIECLNYITTGNMPPNTKGGAFVHDPKLVNEKDVKAQVRLRFRDAKKDRYNVVRNLQVTTKKGGNLSMSTLEGILQFDKEETDAVGAKRKRNTTISSRCAEIDTEIPRLLGVSTSILENVIFCHQEDSNWPLSEPAKLKTKFDNIFEATKFTKALKHIKDLHKDRVADSKADKVRLEGLKEDQKRAQEIRDRKANLEADRGDRDAERQSLEKKAEAMAKANGQLAESRNQFYHRLAMAEALENQQKLLEDNMQKLQKNMTVMEETDEALEVQKADFNKHLKAQQAASEALGHDLAEKKKARSKNGERYQAQYARREVLQDKKKSHVDAMEARKKLVQTISSQSNLRGFDVDSLDEAQVKEFVAKLNAQVEKADNEYQRQKDEARAEMLELDNRHSDAQAEVKSKRMELQTQEQNIRKTNQEVKKLEDEIGENNTSERDLDAAQKAFDDAKKQKDDFAASMKAADLDQQLKEIGVKLREAELSKDDANDELSGLNKHADDRARLYLKEEERGTKKAGLQTLLDKSNEVMQKYTGRGVDGDNLEREVDRLVQAKEDELSEAKRAQSQEERQLQQLEVHLSSKRSQLAAKQKDVDEVDAKIKAALAEHGDEYASLQELIKELEKNVAIENENIMHAAGNIRFLDKILGAGHSAHKCATCNRELDEDEMPEFEQQIERVKETYRKYQTDDAREQLEKLKKDLSDMKVLRAKEEEVEQLKDDQMANLKTVIKTEEAQQRAKRAVIEEKAAEVEAKEREVKDLAVLKRNSIETARINADIKSLDREIQGLYEDLASSGNTRSADDVKASIKALNDEIAKFKAELKAITERQNADRGEQSKLERDFHRNELLLHEQKQKFEQSQARSQRLAELKRAGAEALANVERIKAQLTEATNAQKLANTALEEMRVEHDRRLGTSERHASSLRKFKSQLQDAGEKVQKWIRDGGDDQLVDCEDQMKHLKSQLQKLDDEMTKLEAEKASVDRAVQQAKITERNLDDNLQWRDYNKQVEKIKEKIKAEELGKMLEQKRKYDTEYETAKRRENEINGKIQHLRGVIEGLRDQIDNLMTDLKTQYNDIDQRYHTELIAFKTNELANFDLEKTAKAVDSAILKYHSIKMEEINEHIRHLWSKTYQGTDIDTIMIKSDPDGGKGAKSYNYRVCMVKDTVEMDMRGRCSAGQKVLASIIIRLALADSFSTNCGILALDEPTTNLDKDNIDALAAALADLIKERAKSNFQLIVITHDEDFLGRLGQQDVIEYYWRVSRNNNQKSEITRHRINA